MTTTKPISLKVDKLRDYQEWKKVNDDDFSLWDYLFGVANIEIALAFTKLFWPDFVEHEEGIFLAEVFNPEIYDRWKETLGNNPRAIEQAMNHIHIDDLLPGSENMDRENLFYLGKKLADMWSSRLEKLYPERIFKVSCQRDDDIDETVVVTFYQL